MRCTSVLVRVFQSTLSMRRATLHRIILIQCVLEFQSTLSMRRATVVNQVAGNTIDDFNPRSP